MSQTQASQNAMNSQKARDYFSAYFEGELETGLRQQFETALKNDVELKTDYDDFVRVMAVLADHGQDDIVVPADLGEQISRRLDKHLWDQKQSARPGVFTNWRMVLTGGLAVVAIGTVVWSLNAPQSSDGVVKGNIIGGVNSSHKSVTASDLTFVDGQVRLVIETNEELAATVRDLETMETIESLELKGRGIQSPLTNEKAEPAVLQIDLGKGNDPLIVVLPGASDSKELSGEGTVIDFTKAVAQTFRTPVLVRSSRLSAPMRWSFDLAKGPEQLPALLRDQAQTITERTDGFLVLSD